MKKQSERGGAGTPAGHGWKIGALCALLAGLTWFTFLPVQTHEFVNYDDDVYVYDNPTVSRGLTAEGLQTAFTKSHAGNWHPLTTLSHLVDCQFSDLNPGGHHRTNLLLHTATVVLLFLALWRLTSAHWPSVVVAALFALHPLRVESVAWVAERKDVLSGLCFALTLCAYANYVRRPKSLARYLTLVLAFALGLMAKPMLVTLPFVLLLLDYWPLRRLDPSTVRRLILEKLPLLALSVAVCVVTFLVQESARQSTETLPLASRLVNALLSYVKYLEQTFWPAKLAVFYPYPETSGAFGKLALALLVLVAISTVAIRWRRKRPYVLVGWLWYLGMLVPVIGLVQVGTQAHADRYTYLPQIGLVLALVWMVAELTASWRRRGVVLGISTAAILATLIVVTRQQTRHWRDSESLWRHALACTPANAVAESNLANALFKQGRSEEARVGYERALAIKPDLDDAHNGLGFILLQQGEFAAAINHFQQALQVRPDSAAANNNLGMAYLQTGRIAEAIPPLERALKTNPDQAETHNNLGYARLRTGQPAAALTHYRRALDLKPDYAAGCNNLAWALATSPDDAIRNGRDAVQWAERAVQLTEGNHVVILRTLAAAYAEAGQFPDAIQTASRALELAARQGNQSMTAALQHDIGLYQSRQPLREPDGLR